MNSEGRDEAERSPDAAVKESAIARATADAAVLRDALSRFVDGLALASMLCAMDSMLHTLGIGPAPTEGIRTLVRVTVAAAADAAPRTIHASTTWFLACDPTRTMRGNAVHRHANKCPACALALASGRVSDQSGEEAAVATAARKEAAAARTKARAGVPSATRIRAKRARRAAHELESRVARDFELVKAMVAAIVAADRAAAVGARPERAA